MASIQKRKNKHGISHWRAVVRIKGFPTVCNHKYEKRTQFKFRDVQRKFRRFKKSELEPVLTLLKEHKILQEWEYKPDNGRPSRMYEVNPLIFETENLKK
ncbi:MAG: hypothetical protein H0V82_12425 [Candidatus Protochlamydia sp.]|nr:hypothetical protein [Candidatus Protochlamydia sp.]